MGSHCARKQCNVDEGIRYMEAAIGNCKTLGVAPLIYKYELANCYCMKLKWDIAATNFEPLVEAEKFQVLFISLTSILPYSPFYCCADTHKVRALCALQLAGCYIMTGQRDKGMAMFQRVPTITKKNSSVDPIVAAQAPKVPPSFS